MGLLTRVLVTEERLLPAVSPLSDVMRQTRTYDTRQSSHFKEAIALICASQQLSMVSPELGHT